MPSAFGYYGVAGTIAWKVTALESLPVLTNKISAWGHQKSHPPGRARCV